MTRLLLACLALLALASPSHAATLMACQDANGSDWAVSPQHPCATTQASSADAGAGIVPVVSAAAGNILVLKAAPGNLYSVYATNLTATAGFLVVTNTTTAPADGAILPLECVPLPANSNASVNYNPGPPSVFGTGITAVVTSATTCFTKTTGVITAFIKGAVQ
jgi:hypothetical protein